VNSLLRHPQPQIGVGEPAIQRADDASGRHRLDDELAVSAPKLLVGSCPGGTGGSRGCGVIAGSVSTGARSTWRFTSRGKVPQVAGVVRIGGRTHVCARPTVKQRGSPAPGSWGAAGGVRVVAVRPFESCLRVWGLARAYVKSPSDPVCRTVMGRPVFKAPAHRDQMGRDVASAANRDTSPTAQVPKLFGSIDF
jgi:hypothetical protein